MGIAIGTPAKSNIGIVTFPVYGSGIILLSHLIEVIKPQANNIFVITGAEGLELFRKYPDIHIDGIKHKGGSNVISRIARYVLTQCKISMKIIGKSNKVRFFVFFIGGPSLILPMLSAKVLGKKVILVMGSSDIEAVKANSKILTIPIKVIDKLDFVLSKYIILYSKSIIGAYNLEGHKHKILIAHEHFLDFNKLRIYTLLNDRTNLVGYIGRFSEEKGTLNFVQAIPYVLNRNKDVDFLIVGDGPLRGKVERYLNEYNLNERVKLIGWISHDNLPQYYNKLKLLVIPSYTEGLPNVMIEAMACGTPVLATSVGGVPDVIKDNETGFIMENNNPQCIADNILRVLDDRELERITKNALNLVEKDFTFEKAVEMFKEVLGKL